MRYRSDAAPEEVRPSGPPAGTPRRALARPRMRTRQAQQPRRFRRNVIDPSWGNRENVPVNSRLRARPSATSATWQHTADTASMDFDYRRIGPRTGLDLGTLAQPQTAVHCIRGIGRGSHAMAPAEPATLWLCMRGGLEVDTIDGPFRLRARQFLWLPGTATARGVGSDGSDWALLALPAPVLARHARSEAAAGLPAPLLFPAVFPAMRPLLHDLVALLRQAERPVSGSVHVLVHALLDSARMAQAPAQAWVDRASGRSESHRRQVVARLLSPRNRILNVPFAAQDLDSLASAARYSKSHFLRMFRDIFGATPHELLIQTRMDLAKSLIANSDLALSEVAASVGYESRYAFARLFKKRVGVTASGYRVDREAA
jgi:AraC-like DNA-binding protein